MTLHCGAQGDIKMRLEVCKSYPMSDALHYANHSKAGGNKGAEQHYHTKHQRRGQDVEVKAHDLQEYKMLFI